MRITQAPRHARCRDYARRLLGDVVLGLVIAASVTLLSGCGGSAAAPAKSASSALDVGLRAPAQLQAVTPDFALKDSTGHLTRLSEFPGKAIVLTFVYTHCPDVCPLIVASLHAALQQLGSRARELQILAVSVDPRGDTPTAVRAFLAAHDMTGRMRYLIGSLTQLAPVWRAWGIDVQSTPERREVGHSAFLYGITGQGKAKVLYPPNFLPAWVAHDAPLLAVQ